MAEALCPDCEGNGFNPVRICCGLSVFACKCEEPQTGAEECDRYHGRTVVPVGVFEIRCTLHCNLCEGRDHHWSYDGAEDTEGNPLMGCRHCPALRAVEDEDTDEPDIADDDGEPDL